MKSSRARVVVLIAVFAVASAAFADGGFFVTTQDVVTSSGFAQVRQDVLMAFYETNPVSGVCDDAPLVCTDTDYPGNLAGIEACGGETQYGVTWYRYAPVESGSTLVSLYDASGSTPYLLDVYEGCPGCTGESIASSGSFDNPSPYFVNVEFDAQAGTTYAIRVSGSVGETEAFYLSVHGPDGGDECTLFETDPAVTYVLRTRYKGEPGSFAWVIPVPNTPTDVTAHPTSAIFEALDESTVPQVSVMTRINHGFCGCGVIGDGLEVYGLDPVTVEAQGEAGIFTWTALRSSGADALVDWLNSNGFETTEGSEDVLASYIADDRHFLAVRVTDDAAVERGANDQIEIPPLQFTCKTSERFYPMAISQVSAAGATDLLMYVLAEHRAEVANAVNATIDPADLELDDATTAGTNYVELFEAAIAQSTGPVMVTEYAGSQPYEAAWRDARAVLPEEARSLPYLTRMRTTLTPDQMAADFQIADAPTDDEVDREMYISGGAKAPAMVLFMQPLAVLALYSLCRHRKPHPRSPARDERLSRT